MEGIIVILIIVIINLNSSKKKLKKENLVISKELENKNSEIVNLNSKIKMLDEKNVRLSKYESLLDVEDKASEIMSTAINEANLIKERYKFILAIASENAKRIEVESKNIKKEATQQANEIKAKAEKMLSEATIESGKIIEMAKLRAQEIGGEALEALNNTKDLEKTAQAMKNIIEGYGNKYILPTYSLLDSLADDFGYTEAGAELKKARERTKLMIKNGLAARCDYVENNRRESAINFVIDAFNGKVDTILSTIKNDNYGTLEQKIKDSFYVVNNLGKAFRNATITEEFLSARLDELKWAIRANELKLKEKEEQRLIKEQIREEERARKEYEKAIAQAAKEEMLLKELMEKAKKELEAANEEQKAKYEEQLKELENKLKTAEEKNQRALSMAQQTKSGHVYIISNIGSFGEDVYKIGMTRRLEPSDRVKELSDASVPFSFDIHAMIFSEDAPKLEYDLHKAFISNQMNKVNPRKEFFKVNIKDIKEQIEKLGINAKWTMLAEAKEYRESLAIEDALANNSIDKTEWMQHQLENEEIEDEAV